ncbi:MAG: hypothetical protein R2851_00585 [Caldilineaceae bacterium]
MTQRRSLTEYAVTALRTAAAQAPSGERFFQEERNIWRPDSWLMQRAWEELADTGAVDEALEVAALLVARNPLTVPQAMLRAAGVAGDRPDVREHILSALANAQPVLMRRPDAATERTARERLLIAAATAAACGDVSTTFTFLERLDQFAKPWDEMIVHPEKRELLAGMLARLGPHSLALALISGANRRFGEAGDVFVNKVALAIDEDAPGGARLLARCVDAMRYAALTTMHSQRMAVAVMARGGVADAVLRQLETIANVQEARRESGLALRKNDQQLLRQVKRPQANADVDFLVYTLQEAVRVMPLRRIDREQRVALVRQLGVLGGQSDGWTAAGAAATLLELGAPKLAIEVVDHIAPNDPTRSEGAIALVSGLLAAHEDELAAEQVQKALAWARTQEGKNAERATVWGLADVFLDHDRPEQALALLDAHGAAYIHGPVAQPLSQRRQRRPVARRSPAPARQAAVGRPEPGHGRAAERFAHVGPTPAGRRSAGQFLSGQLARALAACRALGRRVGSAARNSGRARTRRRRPPHGARPPRRRVTDRVHGRHPGGCAAAGEIRRFSEWSVASGRRTEHLADRPRYRRRAAAHPRAGRPRSRHPNRPCRVQRRRGMDQDRAAHTGGGCVKM